MQQTIPKRKIVMRIRKKIDKKMKKKKKNRKVELYLSSKELIIRFTFLLKERGNRTSNVLSVCQHNLKMIT